MSVITQTAPAHVAAFSASGYKRVFSSLSAIAVDQPTVAPALRVPQVQPPAAPFQTQPFVQTNARVPIARACLPQLRAGSVAFVSRGMGPKPVGATEVCPTAPSIHVVGMEELNGMLAQPHNFVTVAAGKRVMNTFYTTSTAASLFKPTAQNGKLAQNMTEAIIMRPVRKLVDGNYTHPLVQYSLDGIVATRPEIDSGIMLAESAGAAPGAVCNVAVHGPAALKVKLVEQDPLKLVRAATSSVEPDPATTPDNYYVRPLSMTAVLYVVLVAERVSTKDGASQWRFQYNLVSSTHLADVNRLAKTRFLDGVATVEGLVANATKLILKVEKLGVVTDSNFVPSQKEVIVSVGIRRVEATQRRKEEITVDGAKVSVPYAHPLHVFETFNSMAEPTPKQERILLRQERIQRGKTQGASKFTSFRARQRSFATGESRGAKLTQKEIKEALKEVLAENNEALAKMIEKTQKTDVELPNVRNIRARVGEILSAYKKQMDEFADDFFDEREATKSTIAFFKTELLNKVKIGNVPAILPLELSENEEKLANSLAYSLFKDTIVPDYLNLLRAQAEYDPEDVEELQQQLLSAQGRADASEKARTELRSNLKDVTRLLKDNIASQQELKQELKEREDQFVQQQRVFDTINDQLKALYDPKNTDQQREEARNNLQRYINLYVSNETRPQQRKNQLVSSEI